MRRRLSFIHRFSRQTAALMLALHLEHSGGGGNVTEQLSYNLPTTLAGLGDTKEQTDDVRLADYYIGNLNPSALSRQND